MRRFLIAAVLLASACSAEIVGDGADASANGAADAGPSGADAAPPTARSARYPSDTTRSPITRTVVDRMAAIYGVASGPADQVFMKVGASGTVSSRFLDCFGGTDIVLDGRDHLQETIEYYDAPRAAGQSSWTRDTLAAQVGRSAGWVISGNPSPLEQEITAIAPRFALVNYGTNDMGLGITHETALWPFYDNFTELLDTLEAQGIIPIITGLNPRSDDATAARWVPTYNTVTRAVAEKRQIPYINLYLASVNLPAMGLVNDGIHGNVYNDGGTRACVFDSNGLQYNYNVRNLLTLETLHDVRRTTIAGDEAPAPDTVGHRGTGSASDPFVIDALPFTHHADTSMSANDSIDAYPSCDSGQDESGPELFYRLDVSEKTPVRILVLDRGSVDVDVHLLSGTPTASACIERDHRIIERTLEPGVHYLALDTFVGSGTERSGAYSLVVVECDPGDSRCQ